VEPGLGIDLDAVLQLSVMRELITLTTFFRQHSLTYRRVCGNARHAGVQ
jgi:hypothetical protein